MLQKKLIQFITILFTSLMLSGCLETMFVGAAGTMVEVAKERPIGDAMTDVRISTAIKGAFIKKNFRDLYAKIKIEVIQGRVLLTGIVDNEQDSLTAVQISWDQENVNEVINELKIDKNSGRFNLFQYTKDTMITSQIKSKIFMNRDIKFINYTVITLNNVVYLFGIASSEKELEKVAEIAARVNSVLKVISHVKVKNRVKEKNVKSREIKNSNNFIIDKDTDTDIDVDIDDLSLDQGIGDDW